MSRELLQQAQKFLSDLFLDGYDPEDNSAGYLSRKIDDELAKSADLPIHGFVDLPELRESEQCREELHARLQEVAIALKGPEGEHHIHGFVDLPRLAYSAQRDAARYRTMRGRDANADALDAEIDASMAAKDQP